MKQKTIQEYINNFEQKRDKFDEETLNRLWGIALNLVEKENGDDRLYCLNQPGLYSGKRPVEGGYSIIDNDLVIRKLLEVECLVYQNAEINEELFFVSGRKLATGLKDSEREIIKTSLGNLREKIQERKMTNEEYFKLFDSSPRSIFTSLYLQCNKH